MSLIRRPSPFGELLSLRQAMDRLFEDSYVRSPGGSGPSAEHALAVDAYSNPEALVIEAALPGVKPDDVEVSLLGDTLTISGNSGQETTRDEDGYSYREIRRGSFSRTLSLPAGLNPEGAKADFENGMLRLTIPKAAESRPRQIRINASGNATQPTSTAQDDTPGQPEQGS
ncbi:MAG TPA: Hsp20/alpha crystallin family protein [Candidatus Limnocylindria bacterium]|nr:Hsp20/alpha crystallin family protein [Candidatus Limnocylindria bacterium]